MGWSEGAPPALLAEPGMLPALEAGVTSGGSRVANRVPFGGGQRRPPAATVRSASTRVGHSTHHTVAVRAFGNDDLLRGTAEKSAKPRHAAPLHANDACA